MPLKNVNRNMDLEDRLLNHYLLNLTTHKTTQNRPLRATQLIIKVAKLLRKRLATFSGKISNVVFRAPKPPSVASSKPLCLCL